MISVILPARNEQWRLPPTLQEIRFFMERHPDLISEVIIVDDGSTDTTVERTLALSDKFNGKLRIERLMQNIGKWSAIRHGISVAKNDVLLLLDADGAASITELEAFDVHKFMKRRQCVFGSRFIQGATINGKSISRNIVSRIYRQYVSFMYWFASGKRDIDDMQCPFKLIYKSRMVRPLVAERFAGDIDLAYSLKGNIYNHPVQFAHQAGSKVSFKTSWNMFWETIRVVRFQKRFLNALRNGTLLMQDNKIYKDT